MLAGNAAKLYDFDLDKLAPLAQQYGLSREELHTPVAGPDDADYIGIGEDMDTDAL